MIALLPHQTFYTALSTLWYPDSVHHQQGINACSQPGKLLVRLITCLLLLVCTPLFAHSHLVLQDSSARSINLSGKAQYFYDASGLLSIDQIRQIPQQFIDTRDTQEMNFGYLTGAVWIKLEVQSELSRQENWVFEFQHAYLNNVDAYSVTNGKVQSFHAGRYVPIDQWPLADRKPAFPIIFTPQQNVTIYMRGKGNAALAMGVELVDQQAYARSSNLNLILLSLYYGALVALGCYNLLLFFGMRQRIFLLYASFVLTFALAAASMNGIANLLLWPQAAEAADKVLPTGFSISATLAVMFARRFLSLDSYAPRWDKLLQVVTVLWGGCVCATMLVNSQTAIEIMSVQAVLTTITLLSAGVAAVRLHVPAARLFVLAWSLLLVGTSLLSIRNTGLIPSNFFTVFSMQIGSVVEMLLLSFALAAKFNDMKRQKERAQAELLKTLTEQEKVLETRVVERTTELEQAKRQLEVFVTRDSLTGVLNRRGLDRCFDQMKLRFNRPGHTIAVMLIDLDEFKPVNDQFGHQAGDILLREIAQRMQSLLGTTVCLGRLGGDEFVVMIDGDEIESLAALQVKGRQLLESMARPVFVAPDVEVQVKASIGIYYCQIANHQFSSALRNADMAMYQVKHRSKNDIQLISDNDNEGMVLPEQNA